MTLKIRPNEFEGLKAFLNAAGYWPDAHLQADLSDEQMRQTIIDQVQAQEGLLLQVLFWVSNTLTLARLKQPE